MAGIINIDVGSIVKGAGSLVREIGAAIRGNIPVDPMKLAELEIEMLKAENVIPTLLSDVDKAQTIINAEDAKSKSFWQSGWRPAAAWICVTALFYTYIGFPVIAFICGLFMDALPEIPKLDMGELLTLLFGLLGLGTLRTLDKRK